MLAAIEDYKQQINNLSNTQLLYEQRSKQEEEPIKTSDIFTYADKSRITQVV